MAKKKNIENGSVDGFSFSKESVIITDTEVYKIELLSDIDLESDDKEFKDDIAYIDNGYYYLYRGQYKGSSKSMLKAGIYKNTPDTAPSYFIVEPQTDDEKTIYDVSSHIATLNPVSIIDTANTKEDLLIAIPESTKIFQPTLVPSDDILKRIAKMALIQKNVDLDRHKDRFKDKNALFNFKQVIRGDNKLSILIFDRGCEALNLKYSIVIEEKDPDNFVGTKLMEPIVVSSEDTYDI